MYGPGWCQREKREEGGQRVGRGGERKGLKRRVVGGRRKGGRKSREMGLLLSEKQLLTWCALDWLV